ncbi:MAG: hypothetical protein KDK64_08140 [Chlamydiia bacterium]|nr:hypothetical protein [Chlamydiia bacterium]
MKKYIFIGLIFLFVVFEFGVYFKNQKKTPVYIKVAEKLRRELIIEAKKNHELEYYGGGGRFLTGVKQFTLSFRHVGARLNLHEVRQLFVNCTEELKEKINQCEEVRPYLNQYPVTEENVGIKIAFLDKKNKRANEESIALVFLVVEDGYIYYEKYNHKAGRFETVHRETYEEAKAIVMAEQEKAL